jgi:hypothetical protein
LPRGKNPIRNNDADVAELVDARDLKSLDGNVVWVRVPPPAPEIGPTGLASEITSMPEFEETTIQPCLHVKVLSRSQTRQERGRAYTRRLKS